MNTAIERRGNVAGMRASVQLGLRTSLSYAEALRNLAEHENLSLGGIIRRALECYAESAKHLPSELTAALLAESRAVPRRHGWKPGRSGASSTSAK